MLLTDILNGVGYVLDTPGALTRGLLAGKPGSRVSGRELLEDWGLVDKNRPGLDAGDVGGFLADILLDPVNLLAAPAIGGRVAKAVLGEPLKVAPYLDDLTEVTSKLPQHTLSDLENIAKGTGEVTLYHGTPAHNAASILEHGVQLPASGEEMARNIADMYDIPFTEWKYRAAPGDVAGGYGTDVARLSTAPANVAARWASHFPQGEVYSELNDTARLYLEAKRRGVPVDELYEAANAPVGRMADALGIPDRMPAYSHGNIVGMSVDARAVPRLTRNTAKRVLRNVERGNMTPEEALSLWNNQYKDIKIHPSNVRNRFLVRDYSHKPISPLAAAVLGYNAAQYGGQS